MQLQAPSMQRPMDQDRQFVWMQNARLLDKKTWLAFYICDSASFFSLDIFTQLSSLARLRQQKKTKRRICRRRRRGKRGTKVVSSKSHRRLGPPKPINGVQKTDNWQINNLQPSIKSRSTSVEMSRPTSDDVLQSIEEQNRALKWAEGGLRG